MSRSEEGLAENLRVIDAALMVAPVELMSSFRTTVSPAAMFAAPVATSFAGPAAITIVPDEMV